VIELSTGHIPTLHARALRHRAIAAFETNIGLSVVSASVDGGMGLDSQGGLGGLDIGLGGWLGRDTALTVRIAGATFTTPSNVQVTSGFIGPSLQLWLGDGGWIGGGLGLAFATAKVNGGTGETTADRGFGLDLRVGVTLNRRSSNSFSLSAEYTPGFFHDDTATSGSGVDIRVDTFAILFGYQYL
jgi:hypothetical protein